LPEAGKMYKRYIHTLTTAILTILVISFTLMNFPLSTSTNGEGNRSYPAPNYGDWVINNNTYVGNETIVLNGNLTIENGGKLTLENVTVDINSSFDGEYGIIVAEGGELNIHKSIISSNDYLNGAKYSRAKFYGFKVWGKMTIENSDISIVGDFTEEGDYDYLQRPSGLQIYSNEVIITRSYIHHNSNVGISVISSSPIIKNNRIEYNVYDGLYLHNSSALIENNTISHHISGETVGHSTWYDGYGIEGESSTPTIINNTISSNGNAILLMDSNAIIEENNISSNFQDGIAITADNATIKCNYIFNNPRYGIMIGGSSSVIEENEIEKNGKGIFCNSFSGPLINNRIENNSYGIYNYYSKPMIVDNYIYNNSERGIYSIAGAPKFENNSFKGNGKGRISQEWYLKLKIEDSNGSHIFGANVNIYDSLNNTILNGRIHKGGLAYMTRRSDPYIPPEDTKPWYSINFTILEYEINNKTVISYTPYRIFVEKDGVCNLTTVLMNKNREITIVVDQIDTDYDKIPDYLDPDNDNDGYNDTIELNQNPPTNPLDNTSIPLDLDNDFVPDSMDHDIDGDGVPNDEDDYPTNPNKWEYNKSTSNLWIIIGIIGGLFVVIILFFLLRKRMKEGKKNLPGKENISRMKK